MQIRYRIQCAKCDAPLEKNRVHKYAYCKKCHAAYMRENRKINPHISDEQKNKIKTRQKTKRLIRSGTIKKESCRICHSPESEVHHLDYGDPLKIEWLCRSCHLLIHGIKNEALSQTKKRRSIGISLQINQLCAKCTIQIVAPLIENIAPKRSRFRGGRKGTCSKCKGPIEESRKGKYAYCKKCHAEYVKNSRKISSPCN